MSQSDWSRPTLTAPLTRVGTTLAVVAADVVEVYRGAETQTVYVVCDHGSGRVRVLPTDWTFNKVFGALGCEENKPQRKQEKK